VLLPCGDSTIRFCPPLVVKKEDADTGLERFEAACKKPFPELLGVRMLHTVGVVREAMSYFTDSIGNFNYQAVDL
jgi:hypothetical protein